MKLSPDYSVDLTQNRRMPHDPSSEFIAAFIARTRQLRKSRKWTQEQMAIALDVPTDRYRSYETIRPLPIYLLERFSIIVGRDIEYVVTGRTARRRRAEDKATD